MKNTIINRKVIQKIAKALGDLNNKVIYVGGATVSLYIDDPAADDIRPTKDIDISIKVASLAHLEEIREQLTEKGFKQTADLEVICRFVYDDVLVDVMATKPIGWAPANPWFEEGFNNLETVTIEDVTIQIMPLPYFLASKFVAYNSRGSKDPRTSHDLEDITYILDNNTKWHTIIHNTKGRVKDYLIQQLNEIYTNDSLQEAIIGNLYYEFQDERFKSIMDKIKTCLNS